MQHDRGVRRARHEHERGVGDASHGLGDTFVTHDLAQGLNQELQAVGGVAQARGALLPSSRKRARQRPTSSGGGSSTEVAARSSWFRSPPIAAELELRSPGAQRVRSTAFHHPARVRSARPRTIQRGAIRTALVFLEHEAVARSP